MECRLSSFQVSRSNVGCPLPRFIEEMWAVQYPGFYMKCGLSSTQVCRRQLGCPVLNRRHLYCIIIIIVGYFFYYHYGLFLINQGSYIFDIISGIKSTILNRFSSVIHGKNNGRVINIKQSSQQKDNEKRYGDSSLYGT